MGKDKDRRPEWCQALDCPYYRWEICQLYEQIKRNWPTLKLRKKEVDQNIIPFVEENRQEIISKCISSAYDL